MIAPLRRRHRWTSLLLLVLFLPALLVLVLSSRPRAATASALPEALTAEPAAGEATFEDSHLLGSVGVRVLRGGVLELVPAAPLAQPDVLVYWSAEAPAKTVPAGAFLLGTLGNRPRRFPLPAEAGGTAGHVVLFSLGHGEVLATGALPAVGPVKTEDLP